MKRIYLDKNLSSGAVYSLDVSTTHRLYKVLRKRIGDRIIVFNGRDGAWRGELQSNGHRAIMNVAVECRVNALIAEEEDVVAIASSSTGVTQGQRVLSGKTGPELTLYFSVLKQAATEDLIRKSTEIGVDALGPIVSERTVARSFNAARWQAKMVAAAEQCGRSDIPRLYRLQTLSSLVDSVPNMLVLSPQAPSLSVAFPKVRGPIALLIGPEGGWSPMEKSMFDKHPLTTVVGLNTRANTVLRAETAALAALVIADHCSVNVKVDDGHLQSSGQA